MEEAHQLADYLPLSYRNTNEQDYIAFLWDAFETNYTHSKYQFAFLAYHMLTMAAVYFNTWQIRHNLPDAFGMAMVGFHKDMEKNLLKADSPFAFHCVNESTVVRFMKLIGCDNAKIGNYAKLVEDRNRVAHCNAVVFPPDDRALDLKVHEILRVVEEIQSHSKPVIDQAYRTFLVESGAEDDWQYTDAKDQVREILIHANYMSRKDVEICRGFDLATLGEHPTIKSIEALHECLKSEYE